MKKQFRGSLKRQHSQGTLSKDSVPFKTYSRLKPKPKPKTRWERFKDWLKELL